MSFFPGQDPEPGNTFQCDAIERVIVPRTTDLGDFRCAARCRRRSGAWSGLSSFVDHMGPAEFKSGTGVDVRPHPHIGLSTVTYLFDGEIQHRDSLGTLRRDPPRRSELDDRRPRHRAFRTHRS